jgi:hypothetical protein
MITLSLGLGVALSDAKDWTVIKKIIAMLWLAVIDSAIVMAVVSH